MKSIAKFGMLGMFFALVGFTLFLGCSHAPISPTPAPPTATPTITPCVPTRQATYSFKNGTECWSAWGPVSATLSWDTTVYDSAVGSTGSLKAVIPFTNTSQQELIGVQFGSPGVTISAASNISMYVMASNNGNAIGNFDQSYPIGTGGADYYAQSSGTYTPMTWTQISNNAVGATPTSIYQIAFQIPAGAPTVLAGQSNGLPVTVWIDAVSVP